MPDVETLPTTDPSQTRQAGMARWMQGLHDTLPNPSLGQGNETVTTEKIVEDTGADPKTAETGEGGGSKQGTVPASSTAPGPAGPVAAAVAGTKTDGPVAAKSDAEEPKWPRSAKEWKNFTQQHKVKEQEYEKQIQEREVKIKELEAKTAQSLTPEVQKKIETLEKEAAQYSERLRILDITNHPKFKNYFDTKIGNAMSQLKGIVKADQIDEVTKLLQAPDSEAKNDQINELLLGMSPLQQGRFLGVINSLANTQSEMQAEIARAKENYDQMVAQAKTQREQQQGQFTKLLDDTIKAIQDPKTGRPEYQLRDGETDWNESVKRRVESARKLIQGNLAADVMFKAAFDAAAHADVLAGYRAALAENDKLKAQVAAMTASNPKLETTRRAEPNGSEPTRLPADARPMDHTRDWIKRMQAARMGEA